MDWVLVAEILYILIVIFVSGRVIYDTQSITKTLAYLLLVIFVPFAGILFYFFFGINYRKRKIYSKRIFNDVELEMELKSRILALSENIFATGNASVEAFHKVASLVLNQTLSPISGNNHLALLLNGENKFPEVIEAIRGARQHIHIEYYIFNTDAIGTQIIELLMEKAREGVEVRFIYDDFGSRKIGRRHISRLRAAGVMVYPFYKIRFIAFANRLNYRNHRKIIVVDGKVGFVGGINVSDKYINQWQQKNSVFWRDTHLRIEGPAVGSLQYVFMGDWNYCSGQTLVPSADFFPYKKRKLEKTEKIVQIVASGPDSDTALIKQSIMQVINVAKEEILITTPYFIPGENLLECLLLAAWNGTKVKLLVPEKSDSLLVDFAARSYYGRLLNAGAEIYLYQKGFVHAKTMVADGQLAVVGTANMDIRSFDLNFEVNAIIYDQEIAATMRKTFYDDLNHSLLLDPLRWKNRKKIVQLAEKIAGLLSPLM